jgi:hypothetical protein
MTAVAAAPPTARVKRAHRSSAVNSIRVLQEAAIAATTASALHDPNVTEEQLEEMVSIHPT